MATYSPTSPYFQTNYVQFYLDVMTDRNFPKQADDTLFEINQTYQYRPDLLAFDLYKLPGLWWVFYQRNPNTLTAPPWDFVAGTTIYIPKISTLQTVLGF
jgi:hypothetical protein